MSMGPLIHPGLMQPQVFERLNDALGYRVIYQEVDPCPNGEDGANCEICNPRGRTIPGKRSGYHERPIALVDIVEAFIFQGDNDLYGDMEVLSHRWRTTPITLEIFGMDGESLRTLNEGEDFITSDRLIEWITPPEKYQTYQVSYTAYREESVDMQHSMMDFASKGKQSETSLNKAYGGLPQGRIAMSIPASKQGFDFKEGDIFIPVDARMRIVTQAIEVDSSIVDDDWLRAPHRFVIRVVRAYGLDKATRKEVELEGVGFNIVTQKWTVPKIPPNLERFLIVYDACPLYVVWLDNGEFRAPTGKQYPRVSVLSRLEVTG